MSDNGQLGVILNLITSVDQRLDGMDQRLGGLDRRLDQIEQTATATRAAVRAEIMSGLDKVRSEVTETRTAIMDRIDRLQNLVTLMRDDIGVNFGRADRAADAALSVRSQVDALGREVTAMERQIQGLQSQVRELQERSGL